ncbi:MAG: nodulation protein NfeD [Phycisphaerae bacterium]
MASRPSIATNADPRCGATPAVSASASARTFAAACVSARLPRRAAVVLAGLAAVTWAFAAAAATPDEDPIDARSARTGAIIPLHGVITDITKESIARRIKESRARGADVIIIEFDTPGGLVTSSIGVADLIRNLHDIKTVAWVNTNAHSGGSLVAVACDEIVMARSSRIGDSQVIFGGPGGAQAVPEDLQPKAYTPVLADFRASAQLNGYSQVLSEAFVLPDREVWWIEHVETGERKFVFREEKIKRLGLTASAFTDPGDAAADPDAMWRLVESYHDDVLDRDVDVIQPVVRSDQLLEMSAAEAQAYGFSKGIVSSAADLEARYDLASTFRVGALWSESLALWMTSMYVRGFLMIIVLLGAYVEFNTPGVGVPGLVALIALLVFVGAPYLSGLANVWEIALIGVGVALIALEIFVIPGFGIAGISGLICLIVGLLATFVPEEPGRSFPLFLPSFAGTLVWIKQGIMTLAASMVMSIAGMVMLRRILPHTAAFQALAPPNPTPSEVRVGDAYHGAARVGDVGRTESPLRPAGKARFGTVLVDVVTQGEFLDANGSVEVVERRGNRVVVRAVR